MAFRGLPGLCPCGEQNRNEDMQTSGRSGRSSQVDGDTLSKAPRSSRKAPAWREINARTRDPDGDNMMMLPMLILLFYPPLAWLG